MLEYYGRTFTRAFGAVLSPSRERDEDEAVPTVPPHDRLRPVEFMPREARQTERSLLPAPSSRAMLKSAMQPAPAVEAPTLSIGAGRGGPERTARGIDNTVGELERLIIALGSAPGFGTATEPLHRVEERLSEYELDDLMEIADRDLSVNVIAFYRGGGYYRTEVDHAFFRERQQGAPRASEVEVGPTGNLSVRPPLPDCLGLFDRILEEFQHRGVKVIINEIDEAPYVFGSPENRRAFREVMQTIVRPMVEARGFPYVTTDQDRLQNDDYFDYNHLNSSGIEKYTPMLADVLRPLLPSPGPRQP